MAVIVSILVRGTLPPLWRNNARDADVREPSWSALQRPACRCGGAGMPCPK